MNAKRAYIQEHPKASGRFRVRMRDDGGAFVTLASRLSHSQAAAFVELRDQGFVYFVQSETTGPIKIGTARDVERRFARLRTMSPYQLRLLAVVPGGRQLEAKLHAKFSRWRLHGEWFTPNPSIFDYLNALPVKA